MSGDDLQTRTYQIGQRLVGLGNMDLEEVDAFLHIFMSYQGMINQFTTLFRSSDRLERLLKLLPNPTSVDTCLKLVKKGWIASASPATTILSEHTEGCTISPTNRFTRDSTSANQKYGYDPVRIEEGNWESHLEQLSVLVHEYDKAERTQAFFFPKLLPLYLSLEGDVSTFCLVVIIYPVITIMNAIIRHHKLPCQLSVRGQAVTGNRSNPGYVDHVIMLHKSQDDLLGTPLVLHEEKVSGAMRDWKAWMKNEFDYQVVSAQYPNLQKMVPQVRKYVFELKTVYTMMSDARHHVGGVWGSCPGWTSGKRDGTGFADRYGASSHTTGTRHDCKVIMGYNKPRSGQLTGRQVLAILCHMALRDRQILLLKPRGGPSNSA